MRVFVCYRRHDKNVCGRIAAHLRPRFKHIRLDVYDFPAGVDYRRSMEEEANNCDVCLVIIGPDWADARDENEELRLFLSDDPVRFEILTVLKRGIPVIPICVDNAELPHEDQLPEELHPLLRCHSEDVLPDPHFDASMTRVVKQLQRLAPAKMRPNTAVLAVAVAIIVAACIVLRPFVKPQLPQSAAAPEDISQSNLLATAPFPARLKVLPAANILQVAYTAEPPVVNLPTVRPAIELAIRARCAGESEFFVLQDGDSLASQRDVYQVALRPHSSGYLYLFQVDSSGNKTWLFPANETSDYSSGAQSWSWLIKSYAFQPQTPMRYCSWTINWALSISMPYSRLQPGQSWNPRSAKCHRLHDRPTSRAQHNRISPRCEVQTG